MDHCEFEDRGDTKEEQEEETINENRDEPEEESSDNTHQNHDSQVEPIHEPNVDDDEQERHILEQIDRLIRRIIQLFVTCRRIS
jgi:hypothetical protein